MPNFNVLATNHTSFTVSNLDRTVAFFRDALGFDVTSKAPRNPSLIERITGVEGANVMIAYVRGSGHSLELIEYSGPDDRSSVYPRPCDVGFAHVAYDVDDIDAAIAGFISTMLNRLDRLPLSIRAPTRGAGWRTLEILMGSLLSLLKRPDDD